MESLSVLLYLKYLNTVFCIVLKIFSYHMIISLVLKKHTSCTHAIKSLKAVVDYYIRYDSTVNLCTIASQRLLIP